MEFHQTTIQEHNEQVLALEAAGIAYHAGRTAGGFVILVNEHDGAAARAEIEAVGRERVEPEPLPKVAPPQANAWMGVVGYSTVLALFFAIQQQNMLNIDWTQAGKLNAGAIRGGEIWRAATALTLHADLVHLFSNVVIGGLVGLFAGQVFGVGLAWLCIFFAGIAGNLVSASIRPAEHSSLGASTAVFAGIGMLAAHQWVPRQRAGGRTLAKLAPLVGGVVLLSMLGTGGERTDVISHVTGFGAGIMTGGILARLNTASWQTQGTQGLLGLASVTILSLAWFLAVRFR